MSELLNCLVLGAKWGLIACVPLFGLIFVFAIIGAFCKAIKDTFINPPPSHWTQEQWDKLQ